MLHADLSHPLTWEKNHYVGLVERGPAVSCLTTVILGQLALILNAGPIW